jgi:hypothetical protein
MWSPFYGLLLTVSPGHTWIDYLFVALGVMIGIILRHKLKSPMILVRLMSTSACLHAIHKDFNIPSDILFITSIPLVYLKWPISNKVNLIWTFSFILNYIWAQDVQPTIQSWLSGFFVALNFALTRHPLVLSAIIICRFFAPRAVHTLYGVVLCCTKYQREKQWQDFWKPIHEILIILGGYYFALYSHFSFLIFVLILIFASLYFNI